MAAGIAFGAPLAAANEESPDIAAFDETTALDENQSTPDSLAGKLRAESDVAANVSVELERNTSSNYTLSITAPADAENVTFYLEEQAVSSSQDVENLTMYLDGEEHDYEVDTSAGPGMSSWIAFEVDHFSTRTVTFTDGSTDVDGELSAAFSVNESSPAVGEPVAFNGSASSTPSGNITAYEWDFDNDSTTDATGEMVTYAFGSAGEYDVTLTVTNESGATDSTTRTVNVTASSTSGLAAFDETTALDENQSTPDSLAGKLRAESDVAANVSVELERNTSSNYTLSITAPADAENVTFYLQEQAVSSSQDVENLTMYLDSEEHDYEVVTSAGPGASPWIAFEVDHFSTRTVTFTDGSTNTTETTHASGVAQSKFDAAAGVDGQLGRGDVLEMVRSYLSGSGIDGTQFTRDDVLDLVRYYITSGV